MPGCRPSLGALNGPSLRFVPHEGVRMPGAHCLPSAFWSVQPLYCLNLLAQSSIMAAGTRDRSLLPVSPTWRLKEAVVYMFAGSGTCVARFCRCSSVGRRICEQRGFRMHSLSASSVHWAGLVRT